MRNKELTDSEIIKAYEFCLNNKNCIGCIADKNSKSGEFDCKLKPQDIIDVFNRLQAENERLQKQDGEWAVSYVNAIARNTTAKAEAYKEFAERLKKHSYFEHKQVVAVELIDNLLKELVGDSQ